jgi:hypothetical protein
MVLYTIIGEREHKDFYKHLLFNIRIINAPSSGIISNIKKKPWAVDDTRYTAGKASPTSH